ncbi:MAG: hypothetical protein ACR2NI_11085 [Pirellulales bacterium]
MVSIPALTSSRTEGPQVAPDDDLFMESMGLSANGAKSSNGASLGVLEQIENKTGLSQSDLMIVLAAAIAGFALSIAIREFTK